MKKTFLTAEWRDLVMANYIIEPSALKPHLPCNTELDFFGGSCYVSLVGFLFANTRLYGVSIPFHRTFEEVNLRFYVRYKQCGKWKRGVVFIKEIVPRRMISFVANLMYGEKYFTHQMNHHRKLTEGQLHVGYQWKVAGEWNFLNVIAENNSSPPASGSEEEFITEHYWGYTFVDDNCTGVYEVVHPRWDIHKVKDYEVFCNTKMLYGEVFIEPLQQQPASVFLAQGSAVSVLMGSRITAPVSS